MLVLALILAVDCQEQIDFIPLLQRDEGPTIENALFISSEPVNEQNVPADSVFLPLGDDLYSCVFPSTDTLPSQAFDIDSVVGRVPSNLLRKQKGTKGQQASRGHQFPNSSLYNMIIPSKEYFPNFWIPSELRVKSSTFAVDNPRDNLLISNSRNISKLREKGKKLTQSKNKLNSPFDEAVDAIKRLRNVQNGEGNPWVYAEQVLYTLDPNRYMRLSLHDEKVGGHLISEPKFQQGPNNDQYERGSWIGAPHLPLGSTEVFLGWNGGEFALREIEVSNNETLHLAQISLPGWRRNDTVDAISLLEYEDEMRWNQIHSQAGNSSISMPNKVKNFGWIKTQRYELQQLKNNLISARRSFHKWHQIGREKRKVKYLAQHFMNGNRTSPLFLLKRHRGGNGEYYYRSIGDHQFDDYPNNVLQQSEVRYFCSAQDYIDQRLQYNHKFEETPEITEIFRISPARHIIWVAVPELCFIEGFSPLSPQSAAIYDTRNYITKGKVNKQKKENSGKQLLQFNSSEIWPVIKSAEEADIRLKQYEENKWDQMLKKFELNGKLYDNSDDEKTQVFKKMFEEQMEQLLKDSGIADLSKIKIKILNEDSEFEESELSEQNERDIKTRIIIDNTGNEDIWYDLQYSGKDDEQKKEQSNTNNKNNDQPLHHSNQDKNGKDSFNNQIAYFAAKNKIGVHHPLIRQPRRHHFLDGAEVDTLIDFNYEEERMKEREKEIRQEREERDKLKNMKKKEKKKEKGKEKEKEKETISADSLGINDIQPNGERQRQDQNQQNNNQNNQNQQRNNQDQQQQQQFNIDQFGDVNHNDVRNRERNVNINNEQNNRNYEQNQRMGQRRGPQYGPQRNQQDEIEQQKLNENNKVKKDHKQSTNKEQKEQNMQNEQQKQQEQQNITFNFPPNSTRMRWPKDVAYEFNHYYPRSSKNIMNWTEIDFLGDLDYLTLVQWSTGYWNYYIVGDKVMQVHWRLMGGKEGTIDDMNGSSVNIINELGQFSGFGKKMKYGDAIKKYGEMGNPRNTPRDDWMENLNEDGEYYNDIGEGNQSFIHKQKEKKDIYSPILNKVVHETIPQLYREPYFSIYFTRNGTKRSVLFEDWVNDAELQPVDFDSFEEPAPTNKKSQAYVEWKEREKWRHRRLEKKQKAKQTEKEKKEKQKNKEQFKDNQQRYKDDKQIPNQYSALPRGSEVRIYCDPQANIPVLRSVDESKAMHYVFEVATDRLCNHPRYAKVELSQEGKKYTDQRDIMGKHGYYTDENQHLSRGWRIDKKLRTAGICYPIKRDNKNSKQNNGEIFPTDGAGYHTKFKDKEAEQYTNQSPVRRIMSLQGLTPSTRSSSSSFYTNSLNNNPLSSTHAFALGHIAQLLQHLQLVGVIGFWRIQYYNNMPLIEITTTINDIPTIIRTELDFDFWKLSSKTGFRL